MHVAIQALFSKCLMLGEDKAKQTYKTSLHQYFLFISDIQALLRNYLMFFVNREII
jgi:hypothetical protein